MRWLTLGSIPLILAAATPAQRDNSLDSRVRAALEKSRPTLLGHLEVAAGGPLALLCLAGVHDELSLDDPVFAKALERLAKTNLTSTYALGVRLMVMADLPNFPNREKIAASDTRKLLRNQVGSGGFGYQEKSDGYWDLSCTQYGALGMRAAVSMGCKVHKKHWSGLYRLAKNMQRSDGSFTYGSSGGGYASMTVAGIAVLELCAQHLATPTQKNLEYIGKRLHRAWQWMENEDASIGDHTARSSFYFHYGLERAAVLSGREKVGEISWYQAGSEMFLKRQNKSGGWGISNRVVKDGKLIRGDALQTSFAILFLRRKFRRYAQIVETGGGAGLSLTLEKGATDKKIAETVGLEISRGLKAVPDLLRCMRSEVVAQRRVAALALLRLSEKDFGYEPYRRPEESAKAIKAAERWWLSMSRKR